MQFLKLPYDRALCIATQCLEVKKANQIESVLLELQCLLGFDLAALVGVRYDNAHIAKSKIVFCGGTEVDPLGLCGHGFFRVEEYPVLLSVIENISGKALYSYQSLQLNQGKGILFGYRNNSANHAAVLYLYDQGQLDYYPYKLLINHLMTHLNHAIQQLMSQIFLDFELSDREIEVLRWLKEGKSNWEISKILNISEHTVKYHVSRLYRKLEVANRGQAVGRAISFGIV